MAEFENDDDATQYMRLRTYALAERNSPDGRRAKGRKLARLAMPLFGWARFQKSAPHAAIAPAPRADDLARELDALPADSLLATNGDLGVYVAAHDRIPIVMHELGRQREIAFRAVGEGTGQPLDLDAFDRTYLHLIVWNHAKREMVGGYRMGLVDQITDRVGVRGMYLSTLFHFAPGFLEQLGHAIELGRSFVRPEYQKSFSPLMLLWKGIGRYCAANPRYSKLIGPVSISSRYSMTSRAMMMQTLLAAPLRSPLASLVTPRTPLRLGKKAVNADVLKLGRLLRDVDELCDVVSDIEADGKSIPILLKQYLKLGAKTLAFNVDPAFGNCLDCLCVLDLTQADQRTVYRYMGRENADRFLTAHGIPIPAGLSREPAAV
jgi:putative hemolysin